MHHHLRSAASRRITCVIRQGFSHRPPVIPRPRFAAPFHTSGPQFLPQPTPIRRQNDQNDPSNPNSNAQGTTPAPDTPAPTPQADEAWEAETLAQAGSEQPSLDDATPATASVAAAPVSNEAQGASMPGEQGPEDAWAASIESEAGTGYDKVENKRGAGGASIGFGVQDRWSTKRTVASFIPKSITDKEEIWDLMRRNPALKPAEELWNTWTTDDKFKYKRLSNFRAYHEQEGLTERQQELSNLIESFERRDVILEGDPHEHDMTMALTDLLAKRIVRDREEGRKGTGILIVCNGLERAKRFGAMISPLASIQGVETCIVRPIASDDPIKKPRPLLTYEDVVEKLEDVKCHVLIMVRAEFQKMVMTDPDARRLLNLVDWQTIVLDDARLLVKESMTMPYARFRLMVPKWTSRQVIFLEKKVSHRIKLAANHMAMKPVKIAKVEPPLEDPAQLVARTIPQSLLVLPSEQPDQLLPHLIAVVLRERAANPERFKAIICSPTPAESYFFETYFKQVQVEPALPDAYNWDAKSLENFRTANEGIMFTYEATPEMLATPFEDLTHIIHINPLDGGEYIRHLSLANLSGEVTTDSAVKSTPKAITVTFPFEYASFVRQPEIQPQPMQMEIPPSPEDLASTSELDRMIKQQVQSPEDGGPKELTPIVDIYEDWLARMVPYLAAWEVKPEELVARANFLVQKLWGGTEPPLLRRSIAESLNLWDVPGLAIRDNLKQWRQEEVSGARNAMKHRMKHWRGKNKALAKKEPTVLSVRGLVEKPHLKRKKKNTFGRKPNYDDNYAI